MNSFAKMILLVLIVATCVVGGHLAIGRSSDNRARATFRTRDPELRPAANVGNRVPPRRRTLPRGIRL